jgi:RNA polymerase sigma-70 factor (ECF subfamily)
LTLTRSLFFGARDSSEPDGLLLARAKQGSRSAFDTLRRLHEQPLRGFIARRVGADAVDDMAQEVWLACWTCLSRYTGRARFKAWLYGIAAHKCADYLRTRARETRRVEAAQIIEPRQPDACGAVELRQTVLQALNRLPDEQREVVELYYYAEMTLAEIAQALNRNLNTVKYQFYRAHAQVAHQLKTEGFSTP